MTSIPAKPPPVARTAALLPAESPAATPTAARAPQPDDFAAPGVASPFVEVAGARIARLDRAATRTWEGTFGQRALEAAYAFYDKTAVTRWVHTLFRKHDTDTAEEVQRALATPAPRDATGAPKSFGDVTVVVNGMLNLVSTPAAMFRIAANTRGPLVIASSNPAGADGYRLRPLEELWGVPVPEALKGKLFALGDLSPNMIPWPQASDLFLEHLSVIDRQFAQLKAASPAALEHVSDLRAAEVTVLGYSQGAVSAAAARKRLEDAGREGLIDRVISVAGAFEGTVFANDERAEDTSPIAAWASRALARVLEQVNAADGRRMIGAMDPDYVAQMVESLQLTPELVDVAYQSSTEGDGERRWLEPFFTLTGKLFGGSNDGVIRAESPFGARVVEDELAKTHLVAWKDFRTFDRILEVL